jgi:AcrR family transcriptional regulator
MGRRQKIEKPELLKIAREVLMRDGSSGAAKKIAKKAGISEAAVIGRLGKKIDLLVDALAPPPFNSGEVIAVTSRKLGVQEALEANADRLLEYFRTSIPLLLPLLGAPSDTRRAVLDRLSQNPAFTLRTAFQVYLHAEAKAERISEIDTEAAASLLVFSLHSMVLFEAIGVQSPSLPKAGVRALVEVLSQGLLSGGSKKRKAGRPKPRARSRTGERQPQLV